MSVFREQKTRIPQHNYTAGWLSFQDVLPNEGFTTFWNGTSPHCVTHMAHVRTMLTLQSLRSTWGRPGGKRRWVCTRGQARQSGAPRGKAEVAQCWKVEQARASHGASAELKRSTHFGHHMEAVLDFCSHLPTLEWP